jgi:HlyD family secretion protein
MKSLLTVLVALVLLGGAGWGAWHWQTSANGGPKYRTERVARGKLVATISATGTLVPEEVVDVGAQVAGQILKFGPDPVDQSRTIDYRSQVEEGTVLAQIDDALYARDVDIARADLRVAVADVQRAEADLEAMKSKLYQAERDWQRARRLGPSTSISGLDYDTTQYAYLTAKVGVPAAEANLEKAKKAVERARAALSKAEKNLDYCTIRSPVKGEIIDRRVNVGQTVVSSLSAPSLFLIAKDLRRMQVWASVNEADVGAIHGPTSGRPGQAAEFTVDAFPGRVFHGEVFQIRYNANMTQNVVTYTVVVNTDNRNLELLPYLTANLKFKVDERPDALLVPNAALRYRPRPERIAPEDRAEQEQAQRRRDIERAKAGGGGNPASGRSTIWVEDNGFVRPVRIRTGLTDGSMTEVVEVLKGELDADTPVVTGDAQPHGAAGGVNPFAPKMFGGGKKE